MHVSRSRRAFLNFISSFGLTIITFATAMISSRLVLAKIGDERFGAFRSLFELFGYLNLVDAGLCTSLRPLLAQSLAHENPNEVRKIFHDARKTSNLGTILACLIGLFLTVRISKIVPTTAHSETDLKLASLIFSFGLINIRFGPVRTLCESMQRSYYINVSLIIQSLCITFTSMILCTQFPEWGISAQATSVVFWVLLFNVLLNHMMKIHKPGKFSQTGNTLFTPNYSLWRNSRDSFILMLAGRVTLQSNSLILGLFVGQKDVTRLYATQRLFDVIQSQLYSVGNSSWAALAEIYHQNNLGLFRKRVIQLIRLIIIMAFATAIPAYHFNQAFVTLWVGQERYGGNITTLLMLANLLALSLTVFNTWCLTGTGHLNSIMRLTIITSSLDILTSLICTWKYGIYGPILGSTCVFYFCSIPWHVHLMKVHLQLNRPQVCRAILGPVLLAIPYSLLLYELKIQFHIVNWFRLALVMCLPTLGYLGIACVLFLEPEEQRIILKKLRIRN